MFLHSLRHSLGLLAMAAACVPSLATAQDYPAKPIRVVIPYAAGGAGDIALRPIVPALEERLGQRLVIENKPGASGNIGAAEVARAAPDGYTLLVGGGNNFASNQFLYRNMSFDPLAVFDLVALITNSPTVVVSHPSLPVASLRELAAHAKANPGKLNFPSPGVGTPPQLSGEYFSSLAGVQMVHIPFNGSPPAVIALQQGEAQVAFYTLGPITPLVRSGKVRVLAVAATARLPALPDAPTTAEAGFPDLLTGSWQAVAAPKGVDARILDRLNADFRAVLANPAVRKRLEDIGTQAGDLARPELAAFWRTDAARWKRVVETANIKAD